MTTEMDRQHVIELASAARAKGECPNLIGKNLRSTDLHGADLSYADLSYADLSHANLTGASLVGANLHNTQAEDILQITGIHPRQIIVTPERDGWNINIGCWNGTANQLRALIAQGTGWPEAEGDEILRRRPLLEAALTMIEAHMAAHPGALDAARQAHARWEKNRGDSDA